MSPDTRPRIAVVFGGRSSEHSISCVSAGSVLAAIDRSAYEVIAVGITRSGRWVAASDRPQDWQAEAGVLPVVAEDLPPVILPPDPAWQRQGPEVGHPAVLAGVDAVFPVLHGPYGEDGAIQGLFELAGLPYVGSGVLASAACMDKAVMKAVLTAAGLPVGPYETLTARQWEQDREGCLARVKALELPVFVKPARAGSSIGITRVSSPGDLVAAIEAARAHDPKVVVEAQISAAREIECGVLSDPDSDAEAASVCAEIRLSPDHEFYSFEAKYLDDSADLIVPAPLPDALHASVRSMACTAFRALGCEGLARVDFFVRDSGDIVINEINTMPGFTPISMFPRMWSACGVSYTELIDRLIRGALHRGTGLR